MGGAEIGCWRARSGAPELERVRGLVSDPDPDPVVDDGVVTSAGVASGIDLSFAVVEKLFGREVAAETAHYIEFRRA